MNHRCRNLFCLILIYALLTTLVIPCLAADAPAVEETLMQYATAEKPELWENGGQKAVDADAIEAIVTECIEKYNLKPDNFSLSYCYTGTGETWSYNCNKYYVARSLYKLPLFMGVAAEVKAGNLKQDGKIGGINVSQAEEMGLIHSNNPISESVKYNFRANGGYTDTALIIADRTDDEVVRANVRANLLSSDFMLRVVEELFTNEENYPHILDCLLLANPGHYFRQSLEEQYEVAQKYGSSGKDGTLHTAGIIYTSTPFILVVMTKCVYHSEECIAELAQRLADYTESLTGAETGSSLSAAPSVYTELPSKPRQRRR